jgi:hypothetical protein
MEHEVNGHFHQGAVLDVMKLTSQSARVPVTEQDNLMSDDVILNEDDVIVNEENVTTNVTHESHVHEGDDRLGVKS